MEHRPAHRTPATSGATPAATTVQVPVSFLSGERHTETLDGELAYDAADPYAVTMRLDASGGPVVWTFARELLLEGRYTPTGDGDVQVWPCLSSCGEAVVIIELSSPSGLAVLQAPLRRVQDFLARTLEVLPHGSESAHLALDDVIEQLLAG